MTQDLSLTRQALPSGTISFSKESYCIAVLEVTHYSTSMQNIHLRGPSNSICDSKTDYIHRQHFKYSTVIP